MKHFLKIIQRIIVKQQKRELQTAQGNLMELSDYYKTILSHCAFDETELWIIIKNASRNNYDKGKLPQWALQKALRAIKYFLSEGLIEAFTYYDGVYTPLGLSPEKTIEYIERELKALRQVPSFGDVCLFLITPKGEQLAHDLDLGE